MNVQESTDAAIEELREDFRRAGGEYAAELAEQVKELINVPVGREGSKIVRSKPGEPPRKESGDYRNTWQSEVIVTGDVVTASAFTNSKIGEYLSEGTSTMAPRPHADQVAQRARDEGASRIKEKL